MLSRSWLIIPLLILYLFDLGGAGFLGPDEPRYASVGREMQRSGDWVTPRLDGNAWFEKPPLLYWLTAAGRLLRLPDEWAARLPVALTSVAFLVFFFLVLTREFSPRIAIEATAILATSAGWLAYSFIAIPDLLMSATLGAAMLIALFDARPVPGHRARSGYIAGGLLGLSILAKGFVPVVLFAPTLLITRGKRLAMLAGCILVAAPWYVLCLASNGSAFWNEFFWKHHVERFFTPTLQHVQPFWYYLPILLAGLFPWTPLAGLLARRKTYDDIRVRYLAAWLVYALLFFSVAENKLPGYVLPLLPPLAIVLAIGLDKAGAAGKWWLGASGLMLVALPSITRALPEALLSGVGKAPMALYPALPFVLVAGMVWWLAWRKGTTIAILTASMAVLAGMTYIKIEMLPILDERVSVRRFWRVHQAQGAHACVQDIRRDWEYGLNYYAGHVLPECEAAKQHVIATSDGRLSWQKEEGDGSK